MLLFRYLDLLLIKTIIKIMSHKMLRPFIIKVSVLGYFPLYNNKSRGVKGVVAEEVVVAVLINA